MSNNIITAAFANSDITYTKPAYQYDYGMILKFSGIELPQAYEVHFSNTEFCGESISQIGDESGVTIPDEMFLSGSPIYAWTFLHTGEDDGETIYKTVISINKRAQPSDIEPTPVQQDVITQAIAALNMAVEQTAQDVIDATAAKDAAETAQGLAESARDAAETAQGKAEDAQEAAETAQGKAEDAQRAAEQAAGSVLGLTADATVDSNVGTPSVDVVVIEESGHKKMTFTFRNLKGVQGDQGIGIASVVLNADYTLTIALTNGTSYTTTSIRGEVGATPNLTIGTVTTLPEGSQATATITGTDEDPVLNLGIPVGDTGVGIASVEKTGTSGLVDTYTITYTNGTTSTFEVTNGQDGEVSEAELQTALIDKADVITSSASGSIVTIADGGNDLPVVDLSVSLLPVQDLHGQDAPYPPGGGINLFDIDHVLFTAVNESTLNNYKSKVENGILYNGGVRGNTSGTGFTIPVTTGNYTVSMTIGGESASYQARAVTLNQDNTWATYTTLYSSQSDKTGDVSFTVSIPEGYTHLAINAFSPTKHGSYETYIQIESGSVKHDYAPYSNYCPISGWTGVEMYHSGEDTSNPTTIPIDWTDEAGTVYGCNLNLTSGVLTVDMGLVDISTLGWIKNLYVDTAFNYLNNDMFVNGVTGEKSKLFCDSYATSATEGAGSLANSSIMMANGAAMLVVRDDRFTTASDFISAVSGVMLAYELKNKIEYQLSPTQIATILGTNNFWSNGNGSLDLEYRADTKLYIQQLTKPTEDDMTANANITSGKFFMIGNRLFLSTTAIAQGEQIVVGTNCTEISLADALNQINA